MSDFKCFNCLETFYDLQFLIYCPVCKSDRVEVIKIYKSKSRKQKEKEILLEVEKYLNNNTIDNFSKIYAIKIIVRDY